MRLPFLDPKIKDFRDVERRAETYGGRGGRRRGVSFKQERAHGACPFSIAEMRKRQYKRKRADSLHKEHTPCQDLKKSKKGKGAASLAKTNGCSPTATLHSEEMRAGTQEVRAKPGAGQEAGRGRRCTYSCHYVPTERHESYETLMLSSKNNILFNTCWLLLFKKKKIQTSFPSVLLPL